MTPPPHAVTLSLQVPHPKIFKFLCLEFWNSRGQHGYITAMYTVAYMIGYIRKIFVSYFGI